MMTKVSGSLGSLSRQSLQGAHSWKRKVHQKCVVTCRCCWLARRHRPFQFTSSSSSSDNKAVITDDACLIAAGGRLSRLVLLHDVNRRHQQLSGAVEQVRTSYQPSNTVMLRSAREGSDEFVKSLRFRAVQPNMRDHFLTNAREIPKACRNDGKRSPTCAAGRRSTRLLEVSAVIDMRQSRTRRWDAERHECHMEVSPDNEAIE